MIRINLLPVKAAQKKEMLLGQLVVLAVSAVVVSIGCVGVYTSLLGKVQVEKERIVQKEDEIAHLRKAIGEVGRFKKLQKELRGKLDVLDKLKEGQTGPVHLLDELSKALPDTLWLTSFEESAGNVSLNGVGLNEETVARFLRNLEESPYYRGVELLVIEQVAQGGRKLQRFDVSCRVEAPPKNPSN